MKIIRPTKDFIRTYSNNHTQGKKKNILLNATPRGGSTWVMEIIASQPGMKFYDEPFNLRREIIKKTKLFSGWEDLQPEGCDPYKIISYLKALENNQYGHLNAAPFQKNHRWRTNRIVFKIHELEHLITQIAEQCNMQVLYLLRHPIPTSLSRYIAPRLNLFLNSPYYKEHYLSESQLQAIKAVYQNGKKLDQLIIAWCFENLIPLKYTDTQNWVTISYEELLLNPRKTCELLKEKLDLDDLDALLASVGIPSTNIGMSKDETHTIMRDSNKENRNKRLVTKWKSKITMEEEKKIFEILDIFELDVYQYNRFIPNDRYLNFEDTVRFL